MAPPRVRNGEVRWPPATAPPPPTAPRPWEALLATQRAEEPAHQLAAGLAAYLPQHGAGGLGSLRPLALGLAGGPLSLLRGGDARSLGLLGQALPLALGGLLRLGVLGRPLRLDRKSVV